MSAPNFAACEALSAAWKVLLDYPELPAVTSVEYYAYAGGRAVVEFSFFNGADADRIAAVDLLAERLRMTEVDSTRQADGIWTYKRDTPWKRAGLRWSARAFNLTSSSTEAETAENSGPDRAAVTS